MWQSRHIQERLRAECGVESEIIPIRTTGDRHTERPVSAMGRQGVFIKEIEDALLAGEIDLAVHSMKDVPSAIAPGLMLPAITRRADPRDCLVAREGVFSRATGGLAALPLDARLGTSSPRRRAQLHNVRAKLGAHWEIHELRGNVDTRLRKLDEGQFDAIVLACAGLQRLGLAERITEILDTDMMLPAAGQGALCVEARAKEFELAQLLASLDDTETRACVTAERTLLARLEGGCQVALGALARMEKAVLKLEAAVLSPDGGDEIRGSANGSFDKPEELGARLAQELLEAGAGRILGLAGRHVA
jgi:hydroxymethylbilane synthase